MRKPVSVWKSLNLRTTRTMLLPSITQNILLVRSAPPQFSSVSFSPPLVNSRLTWAAKMFQRMSIQSLK
ncbi:hypothetical protein GGI05_005234, partial [Coemansia sp. RSA 2603]